MLAQENYSLSELDIRVFEHHRKYHRERRFFAVALEKEGIKVNFLVTIDAAKGPVSIGRTIPDNVEENLNIYQTKESKSGSVGGKNTRSDGKETGITNKIIFTYTDADGSVQNVDHYNIDEATLQQVINAILQKLNAQ